MKNRQRKKRMKSVISERRKERNHEQMDQKNGNKLKKTLKNMIPGNEN